VAAVKAAGTGLALLALSTTLCSAQLSDPRITKQDEVDVIIRKEPKPVKTLRIVPPSKDLPSAPPTEMIWEDGIAADARMKGIAPPHCVIWDNPPNPPPSWVKCRP
jgi:hypothetical protein